MGAAAPENRVRAGALADSGLMDPAPCEAFRPECKMNFYIRKRSEFFCKRTSAVSVNLIQ